MKINGIEYNLPRSWKDVNLKKYLLLSDVIHKEYESELIKTVTVLSALTGVPTEVMMKNENSFYIDIQRSIKFINNIPNTDVVTTFVIDNIIYETVVSPNQITTEEFLDLNGLTKTENDLYKNLPTLTAIFFRPVIKGKRVKSYDPVSVEERKELFLEKLSADKCFGLATFFLSLRLLYLSRISKFYSKTKK